MQFPARLPAIPIPRQPHQRPVRFLPLLTRTFPNFVSASAPSRRPGKIWIPQWSNQLSALRHCSSLSATRLKKLHPNGTLRCLRTLSQWSWARPAQKWSRIVSLNWGANFAMTTSNPSPASSTIECSPSTRFASSRPFSKSKLSAEISRASMTPATYG